MFFRRTLLDTLRSPVSRHKIRLLFGARQTGKTELLRHVVPSEQTWRVDLSATTDRRRYEMDPGAFGRELRALPRAVRTVVVDEIQKVPALLDEVQNVYDEDRARFELFLTGSSARRLRRSSANLLPGRCHTFHLYPTSHWECEGPPRIEWPGSARPQPASSAEDTPAFPEQGLERTLLLGNLPGVRGEPDETAAATLQAYVENYVEDEIRREALARDLGAFGVFLRLAAVESGGQVNIAALSRQSGIAASTLKGYYELLIDTFTGYWVHAYTRAGRARLLTTPRFLLFDTGVRNAAAGLPSVPGMLTTEGPRLLEQWVTLELVCRAAALGRGYGVSFWRTVSGAEVDVVWEGPREDVPIEVKWSERPTPHDARHLEAFLDAYPKRAHRGLVVCRAPRAQQLTERVLAVPWNAF